MLDGAALAAMAARTLEQAGTVAPTGWRIEVKAQGKYFDWRQGSGKKRKCRYGGTFKRLEQIAPERAQAYRERKADKDRVVAE